MLEVWGDCAMWVHLPCAGPRGTPSLTSSELDARADAAGQGGLGKPQDQKQVEIRTQIQTRDGRHLRWWQRGARNPR